MTEFADGPAAGVCLTLRRSPRFLRVTFSRWQRDPAKAWDALDQLHDAPRPGEALHCYRRTADRGHMHLRPGGCVRLAEYAHVPDGPDDATMRDQQRWRAWCLARQAQEQPR